jgi:NADPH:quinone reductase-like Zn-dependent oxidoreductase
MFRSLPRLFQAHISKINMSTASQTQKAIRIFGPKKAGLVTDASIPEINSERILIKVKAVALNPTDWKHIDFLATEGATVGCDVAGIVEKVGSGVKDFKVGDRVAAITHGCKSKETYQTVSKPKEILLITLCRTNDS